LKFPRNHQLGRSLLLLAVCTVPSTAEVCIERYQPAPTVAADQADSIFDYDHTAPLSLREVGREARGSALIRDIAFTPVDKPVRAFLVSPTAGAGQHAAILYVHWLGEPATSNRTEFLDEAMALAGRGVFSLLVDTMWAEPKWYGKRVPEEDFARSIRQVIELRRALDLLLAQPGVDSHRVALVGHDFGSMYGLLAGALDQRPRTYVLMAGVPHFIDWFLFARQPQNPAAYRLQIAPLDPANFISRVAHATVFFQFAQNDDFVSAAQAAEFYAAAGPRKQQATYAGGHALHTAAVAADRVAWLARELDLN
jgi:predicted esterase